MLRAAPIRFCFPSPHASLFGHCRTPSAPHCSSKSPALLPRLPQPGIPHPSGSAKATHGPQPPASLALMGSPYRVSVPCSALCIPGSGQRVPVLPAVSWTLPSTSLDPKGSNRNGSPSLGRGEQTPATAFTAKLCFQAGDGGGCSSLKTRDILCGSSSYNNHLHRPPHQWQKKDVQMEGGKQPLLDVLPSPSHQAPCRLHRARAVCLRIAKTWGT